MSLPDAKSWGAVALFGETYEEDVRVVQIGGPWSRELCGGTHVSRSSQIGMVSLIGDSSVGSGSRRIEALVGIEAFRALAAERALVARLGELFKAPRDMVEERIAATIDELKTAQKKLASLQAAALAMRIPDLVASARAIGGVSVVATNLGALDSVEDARGIALQLRERLGVTGVAAAFAEVGGKPALVVAVGVDAQNAGVKAGALVKTASAILGGGGGGKDDIAQGGGQFVAKIDEAIAALCAAIG
jgi:alanyl-tRNA synthetase